MAIKVKKSEKKEAAVNYTVTVMRAKQLDNCIGIDLQVNGVKIYNCFYRTYEDRDNPGDEKAFIAFPSRKGSDGKWYQYAWFRVDEAVLQDIEKQIESLLA